MSGESRLSDRVNSIPPSGIRRFFDIASEMDDVVTLGVGEPDFTTPWHIIEQAIFSMEKGYTMYTANHGLMELREKIAAQIQSEEAITYNPANEVLVTVGVSEALDLALRALVNDGDEVMIVEPCYVSYQACVALAGGKVVEVPTFAEDGFSVKASEIEKRITPKTKCVLLCYPNNPTGATIMPEELQKIAELAIKHDLIVLSDEIYSKLLYEGKYRSIASLPGMKDRTVLLGGFSKAYAMTGWRIGYAAGPVDIMDAMTKIHQYTMLCAPIMAQKAAIEALDSGYEQMMQMVKKYNQRRRLIVDGLNSIGLPCHSPQGAFYVFPLVAHLGLDDETFAERLLYDAKVAVVPGSVFGPSGKGHIRCSYASSVNELTEAIERMGSFVKKLKG